MIYSIISNLSKSFATRKTPTIQEVQKCWNDYSSQYNTFDLGPQTFYYSLINMSHIWQANRILQVACGTGKLLPFALQLKKQSASYLAVDISPRMIELSKVNVKNNFLQYESKFSFEEWLKSQKLTFRVANAQQPIQTDDNKKFDRIICNCVLMLTQSAEKMLKSLSSSAQKNCLLGLSVWGDKEKNNYMMSIRESILQAGFQLPNERSNFHLYQKVQQLAEKCGWEVVLKWQQNALFPILSSDEEKYGGLFFHQVEKLPEEQQSKVKEILMQKIKAEFEKKKGLNFSCELYILRKK